MADYLGVSAAVLLGREPLPEQDAPAKQADYMSSVPEVKFFSRTEDFPHGVADVVHSEQCVWSVPLKFMVRRLIDPGRCIILEAPEAAEGIAKGDKVVVYTNDKTPSPPGLFLVWDGWAAGLAHLSMLRTAAGEWVRVHRPGAPELLADATTFEPMGRVVARWAWM